MHIDLVDRAEIERRTGVSIDIVDRWVSQPGFPEPTAELSIGDIWVWGAVHSWLRRHNYASDVDLNRNPLY